jgi:hypothetical protein
LGKDDTAFDFSGLELFDLEKTAVRHVTYAEQEAFYMGEGGQQEESSASSSSVDW